LQRVAVCCRGLQLQTVTQWEDDRRRARVGGRVRVAVCCIVLQCVAESCSCRLSDSEESDR